MDDAKFNLEKELFALSDVCNPLRLTLATKTFLFVFGTANFVDNKRSLSTLVKLSCYSPRMALNMGFMVYMKCSEGYITK